MRYILYVPGLPFDGNTIKSGKSLGGSETMGFYMAKGLADKGHEVVCFCNTPEKKNIDGVEYAPIGEVSQSTPFGASFQHYASNVPHDVLLAQRAAGIFGTQYASKLNYFWTHDLALTRYSGNINNMMWNTNKVLGVSQFHVDQIKPVYGIDEQYIGVLPNGIDLELCKAGNLEQKQKSKILLYTSRPERGLINLVAEGGIMEQLYKADPEITLMVAGYDNVSPEMKGFYDHLYQRCELLPNVHNHGYLSKQELSEIMQKAWLHVYPTDFEEVSCITAMEEQAAGTPFLSTKTAALPETLKDGGVYWSKKEDFVKSILYLANNKPKYKELHEKALRKAKSYAIENSIARLEAHVESDFKRLSDGKNKLFSYFVYNSDVAAAAYVNEKYKLGQDEFLLKNYETFGKEVDQTIEFYDELSEWHKTQGDDHGLGNDVGVLTMPRVKPIMSFVSGLKPGSKILDYGSCVGHITIALARQFPDMIFEGCDINETQVETANNYAIGNKIDNVSFFTCSFPDTLKQSEYDLVLCCEVVEHIWDYQPFLIDLEKAAKLGAQVVITTPYGAWEALSYNRPPYKRQHLHHFEAEDIKEIIGHKANSQSLYLNSPDQAGEKFGAYLWTWVRTEDNGFGKIDYERKNVCQNPKQEVTACIITKGDSGTIKKALDSIAPFVDEFIIAIDKNTFSGEVESCLTYQIAQRYKNAKIYANESPTVIGFDEARNFTVQKATKDWVLWIDDDEVFVWPDRIKPFITDNHFNAYAIPQHHFSAEPAGLTKTDLPCRLFRNKKGIRFFGTVHEHPELGLNIGTGNTFLMDQTQVAISHFGYENEDVRRKRFQRNFPLMIKDKEKYPERFLRRALWIRDLDHLNRFEFERSKQISTQMIERCNELIENWRKLIELGQTRYVIDSLPYVTDSINFMTQGKGGYSFKMGITVDGLNLSPLQNPTIIEGKVQSPDDIKLLNELLLSENLKIYENGTGYL